MMRKHQHEIVPSSIGATDIGPVTSATRVVSRNEPRNPKPNYYEYYKKLYVINKALELQIKDLMAEREDLNSKINEVCFFKDRWSKLTIDQRAQS